MAAFEVITEAKWFVDVPEIAGLIRCCKGGSQEN